MDDKNIFDNDAENLAIAMAMYGAEKFFVVKTYELLTRKDRLVGYEFSSTKEGIEAFQRIVDLNINDCLLVDEALSFAVIRTGGVDYTLYAGPKAFVEMAMGVMS